MKKTWPLSQSMQARLFPLEHTALYLHHLAEILCPQGLGATQKGKLLSGSVAPHDKGGFQVVAAPSESASASLSTPSF